MQTPCPVQCIIPPYIVERLAQSSNPKLRSRAVAQLSTAAAMRTQREMSGAMPTLMASMAPERRKHRLVYSARGSDRLPGKLVRSEGRAKVADAAVNEAYDYSGYTYDFYQELFQRNSLDNNGMTLISSVHVGEPDGSGKFVPMDNAFWNGEQMAYGDGDGIIFTRFTASLDVVGHELTHGVQAFTSNLAYRGQSGALNEHFADAFGVLIRQWKNGEPVAKADWSVGREILVPAKTRRAIRDMEHPGTAFVDDPDLGTDPQPGHISGLYTGASDRGGVHINSGIPNRVFVLFAKALGGKAWETAGRIWFDTMLQLKTTSPFAECARISVQVAGFQGAAAAKAAKAAWSKAGITV